MTQSPDFGVKSWRRIAALTPGLCVIPIWYQIFLVLVPDSGDDRLRVLFVLISGMPVTTTATGEWSMPLFSFRFYSLVILLFVVNFCVVHVDFRHRFFRTRSHLVGKVGADFSAPSFGTDFWNVCHQLYTGRCHAEALNQTTQECHCLLPVLLYGLWRFLTSSWLIFVANRSR